MNKGLAFKVSPQQLPNQFEQTRKEHLAKMILEEESDNIWDNQFIQGFDKQYRLKTDPKLSHDKTSLRRSKKQLITYSSQKINQISKRLAAPRNPIDKQNKHRSVMQRRLTGKRKDQYKLILPSIKTLKTQQLKLNPLTTVESTCKIVQKWIQKKGNKPNRIQQLIQKLEVIKKSNQKRSMQRLPFIFIQSMNSDAK